MLQVLLERRIVTRVEVDTDDIDIAKRAAKAGECDEVGIEEEEMEAIEVCDATGECVWTA